MGNADAFVLTAVVVTGIASSAVGAIGAGSRLLASDDAHAETLRTSARASTLLVLATSTVGAALLPLWFYAASAIALALVVVASKSTTAVSYVVFGLALAAAFGVVAYGSSEPTLAFAVGSAIGLAYVLAPIVPRFSLLESALAPGGQALALAAFGAALGGPRIVDGHLAAGAWLGVVALSAFLVVGAVHLATRENAVRSAAVEWLGVVGLAASTFAIVIALKQEALTSALAVTGVALVAASRRLERPVIATVGAVYVLFAGALVLDPAALAWHARGAHAPFDWTLVAYLATAFAAFAVFGLLRAEPRFTRLRSAAAAFGFLATFVWMNVAVLDLFTRGDAISFAASAGEGRDLAMSLSWALFAMALLSIGMRKNAGAVRKTSLALALATVVKAFVYDLGALENLYRVAALVGLAFSLLGISVLYQRFVFRPARRVDA